MYYFSNSVRKKISIYNNKNENFKLLDKINPLTIFERRQLALVKFVWKQRKSILFSDWFVKSKVAGSERYVMPKSKKMLFNDSIQYQACKTWNLFVQNVKFTDLQKIGYEMFVKKCKEFIVSDRGSNS